MENMKKMGEDMKRKFDSPEWKAQMENMKKQGEEMKKKFDSPEWKAQMENMKKQGEEMRKKFDGPEWKAQMDAMKKMGEDMKRKFDSPEWKAQMENMKKMGEDMQKQFKGEFKYNMKWDLRDSSKAGNDTVGKPRLSRAVVNQNRMGDGWGRGVRRALGDHYFDVVCRQHLHRARKCRL